MRVALLITTYNRPKELKECLQSLKDADLSGVNELMIVDDASTSHETVSLIRGFNFKDSHSNLVQKQVSKGIKDSLLIGYEKLFQTNEVVINLDGDAVVKPDFVKNLIKAFIPSKILTGFNSVTKNSDGSERHLIIPTNSDFQSQLGLFKKRSVGGINLCIDKWAYDEYVCRALMMHGNWDHNACILAGGAYCLKKSVVQHIGFNSSMGHVELPDTAEDFYLMELPEVTLIGADSNPQRLELAKLKCTSMIKFGKVVTLNPDIRSKEQYSLYALKELAKHVTTSHALIFQHDGFVNNWRAWDNSWLQYDYIGAPWWYQDGMNVGNGGFSLRSKKLIDILATDTNITQVHPEDHHICRTYRPYLEEKYGIKFAPYEVAERFSFEGYMRPGEVVTDQFGVHGNYNNHAHPKPIKSAQFIFNQFRGLGDILFLVPLCRALMREGNSVLWPIVGEYMNIAKHFPDINFVPKEEYNLPYDSQQRSITQYGQMLPYRYAMELMRRDLTQCMQSKYELYGHDWKMWRELFFKRFPKQEIELADRVGAKGKYVLVNRYYGNAALGMQITPELPTGVKVIEMQTIEGFSMIDWCGIIEGATEIHTANTSLLYILEMLNLKMPIHMYRRNTWQEKAFEHTQALYTKPYILH